MIKQFNDDSDWIDEVKTDSNLPDGTFLKSSKEIAKILREHSESYKQAMSRLNFYINRAGKNLSEDRLTELNKAKDILPELYKEVNLSKKIDRIKLKMFSVLKYPYEIDDYLINGYLEYDPMKSDNPGFYVDKSVDTLVDLIDNNYRVNASTKSLILIKRDYYELFSDRDKFLEDMKSAGFCNLAVVILRLQLSMNSNSKLIVYGYTDAEISKVLGIIQKYSTNPILWRLDNLKTYKGNIIPQYHVSKVVKSNSGKNIILLNVYDHSDLNYREFDIATISVSKLIPDYKITYSAMTVMSGYTHEGKLVSDQIKEETVCNYYSD